MQLEFTDGLNITKPVTRDCYRLMLKISDLWFAFEHLVKTSCDVIPKKKIKLKNGKASESMTDLYDSETINTLGFLPITSHFNQLLKEHVLHKDSWRNEVYIFLGILKKNTLRETQETISDLIDVIRNSRDLEEKHIFALAYGIRNIYVHKGVSAALGGKKYEVKRALYSALYDCLILYSLALGNRYCESKLEIINKIYGNRVNTPSAVLANQ